MQNVRTVQAYLFQTGTGKDNHGWRTGVTESLEDVGQHQFDTD